MYLHTGCRVWQARSGSNAPNDEPGGRRCINRILTPRPQADDADDRLRSLYALVEQGRAEMENVLKNLITALKADSISVTHCDTQPSSYICVAGRCGKAVGWMTSACPQRRDCGARPSPVSSERTGGRAACATRMNNPTRTVLRQARRPARPADQRRGRPQPWRRDTEIGHLRYCKSPFSGSR